jgi:hypothetical protein
LRTTKAQSNSSIHHLPDTICHYAVEIAWLNDQLLTNQLHAAYTKISMQLADCSTKPVNGSQLFQSISYAIGQCYYPYQIIIVYATYTIILIYQLCTPIMPPLLLVARLTSSGVKGKLNTYLLTLVTPLLPLQKQIMHAASSLGLYLST